MIIINFATETDKYRVVSGKWCLFDGNLFALKDLDGHCQITKTQFDSESYWVQLHELPVKYMDRFYGTLIGNTIGKVLEFDVENDDTGWGKFLRV